MGGLDRRGFLKAIGALSGALVVSGAGFASIPATSGAALFEWKWGLFDCGQQLGVCASLMGPDGIKYRHAVRMYLPIRADRKLPGHINHEDLPFIYPKAFAECRQALGDWAWSKQTKWHAMKESSWAA